MVLILASYGEYITPKTKIDVNPLIPTSYDEKAIRPVSHGKNRGKIFDSQKPSVHQLRKPFDTNDLGKSQKVVVYSSGVQRGQHETQHETKKQFFKFL